MYDLVIRGGTVVDGTGLAPVRADVAVAGDRIAAVGRVRERGTVEVDADGHAVTPGFIDGHTHMDAQVMWDPLGSSSCWHGVTTVVMGNCGFTLAPVRSDERALVVRNLEKAEDISAVALAEGIPWTWETFPEFLDTVERLPKGINYSAYVGHSALRTWAMGEAAFDGTSSVEDLGLMQAELRRSLEAGAMGLSTSRGTHETSDGRPVASRMAAWDELRGLVGVLADAGAGILQVTMEPQARGDDPDARRDFFARQQALAVDTGVPCTFGVSAFRPDGVDWRSQLALIDSTTEAGGVMFGQSHSRGISKLYSFRSHLPFDGIPAWVDVRRRSIAEQHALLRDAGTRRRLADAARAARVAAPGGTRAVDCSTLRVLDRPLPPFRSVGEVAAERRVDPVDAFIDLALEADLHRFFLQPLSIMDPETLLEIMRHPRTIMTFSDSGAHVGQIMDSSIQTHLLAYWVRQRQAFTIEEAVRMLTLAPARAWGFSDRGLVRPGMVADLNVFDPEVVGPAMPEVVHTLPGGEMRLEQRATGFRATVVGGQVLVRDGEHTGALPGRLLRGPLARAPQA